MCGRVCAQSDRLQPIPDYFNLHEHERAYYPYVHKHLVEGLSKTPLVRVLTVGGVEQVVSLEETDGKEEYKLILRSSAESIWYKEDRDSVEVNTFVAEIEAELAKAIGNMFHQATSAVSYPEEIDWRPDHTTYFVTTFTREDGIQTGRTNSPDEKTMMGLLVEMTNVMMKMARANEEDKVQLVKQLKTLASKSDN